MNEVITQFLQYLDRMCGFSDRTVKQYKRFCMLWIGFLDEKDKVIGETDPTDFLDYIELRSKKVKSRSLARELCVIRTFYGFLCNCGLLDTNPAASIPELICEPYKEKSWLTVEECFQFLDAFDLSDPLGRRNYTLSALLWCTGLRNSELRSLNRGDIDLEQATLLVRKGKGGKQRQLFFNGHLQEVLKEYYREIGGGPDDPVFYASCQNGSRKGKHARLSQAAIVEMIRKHGKKAGLEKAVNPLTFRHCFATHMYEVGAKIADIKEMLGHDDETETTIYVHISINTVKQFLQKHPANSTHGREK